MSTRWCAQDIVDVITGAGDLIDCLVVPKVEDASQVHFVHHLLAPREIEPGVAIELEVALVDRPLGFGRVQMCTAAHVVRAEESEMPGWRGYAASFDDFALQRDDALPRRHK